VLWRGCGVEGDLGCRAGTRFVPVRGDYRCGFPANQQDRHFIFVLVGRRDNRAYQRQGDLGHVLAGGCQVHFDVRHVRLVSFALVAVTVMLT